MKNAYSVCSDRDHKTKPVMLAIHDHFDSGKNPMSDRDAEADEIEKIFPRTEDSENSKYQSELYHDDHSLHRVCLGGHFAV